MAMTRKNKRSAGTRKAGKGPKVTTVKTVAQVVKKVMRNNLEHKHKSWVITDMTPKDGPIQSGDILPIVGPISLGTGANQRVGARVKPVGLWLKGHLCFNPDTGGQSTILPRVYILNSRKYKTNTSVLANSTEIASQLLDNWDGANTNFTGDIDEWQYPVNLDDFTVVKVLNTSITKDNTTSSDGKSYHDFMVRIPTPANFNFDEGSTYVTNFAPFVAVGWVNADGEAPVAPYPETLYVTMKCFLSYIDA